MCVSLNVVQIDFGTKGSGRLAGRDDMRCSLTNSVLLKRILICRFIFCKS